MKPKYKPVKDCKTVAELLADPKRWTKGCFARNEIGRKVNCYDESAVCWCLEGAFSRIYGDTYKDTHALWQKFAGTVLSSNPSFLCLPDFNDDPKTTHKQVMAVVKTAGI